MEFLSNLLTETLSQLNLYGQLNSRKIAMRVRSFLFTPANRIDRMKRARASGADWIILDLEDGVPPADRAEARHRVARFLQGSSSSVERLAVRISSLATADGVRDLAMLVEQAAWPEMVVLPKVETAKEVHQLRSVAVECGAVSWIMVTLESASALADAAVILRECGSRVVAGYGSGDHTAQTGARMSETGLAWARGQIVNAAAVAGVPVVDGVCVEIRNHELLRREAELALEMGFWGKIAIHPEQVSIINTTFTPTSEAVAHSRELLDASEAVGGGAFAFRGKMVDGPILAQARRILDAAAD